MFFFSNKKRGQEEKISAAWIMDRKKEIVRSDLVFQDDGGSFQKIPFPFLESSPLPSLRRCILTEGAQPSSRSILIRDYERRRARKLRWTDNDGVHRERVGFQIHRLWNCLICPLYTPSSAVSVSLISIETRIDPSTR